jgi:colanic acid/amylovoran biosynthesis glycosyltransferase
MKIVMYSDAFGGATTTFIQNDLIELARLHEVKYLCVARASNGNFDYKDVEMVEFSESALLRKIHWILERKGWFLTFRNKRFAKKVNRILTEFGPDIIQCNFGYEALRLTDNLEGANRKIPLVINFLGYDASFHLSRPSYVRKLRELTQEPNVYATCNTAFLKNNLEAKNIIFKNIQVIHTGVRLDYFDRKSVFPEQTKYVFLQIATLAERKGQEITMRAFKRYLELFPGGRSCKLIIAGGKEDAYGEFIRKLPAELGIQDAVEFRDWISTEEARMLMLNANCFVHHSRTIRGRTEGIPTVMSEAMSMQLPVISTWHAGIPELVEDGVNGFLVKENDIEAYAHCMHKVQSWPLMLKNREKVDNLFNIVKRTEKFLLLYKQILERSS